MYKQVAMDKKRVAGKRILCSNRYGRVGCGRTRQLYLADVIPQRHYSLAVVIAFIQTLLAGSHVEHAYLNAVAATQYTLKAARHAWRWLTALFKQLSLWRTYLDKSSERVVYSGPSTSLKHLLPTLDVLLTCQHTTLSDYQHHFQRAFF